jgi:predicted PurR-regulated permease PerM
MLGIDHRAARATWTVFLVALVILLAWLARTTLLVFTISLLLAYLLNPLVELLRRVLPPKAPAFAAPLLVYLAGITAVVIAVLLIGTRIANEAAQLATRFPEFLKQRDLLIDRYLPSVLAPYREQIHAGLTAQLESGQELLLPALSAIGQGLMHQISSALYLVLIPLLAFLMQLSLRDIRAAIVELFDDRSHQRLTHAIVTDIDKLLGQYMQAAFLLSLATFFAHLVFYSVIGMPYGVLLAGICGVLEYIPFLGPLSAAVIAVSVGAFSGYPHVWWIVVFSLAYRLFQDYVLQPILYSHGIEMHPLLVLFGVLAGEQIGGITGMFLSVPVLAMVRIVYRQTLAHRAEAAGAD